MEYTDGDIIAHIAKHYAHHAVSIACFTNGRVNTSYCITSKEASFVFRIYAQKTIEEIQCEISILEALAEENFPSQKIQYSVSGSAYTYFQGKVAVLASYISGVPASFLAENQLHMLGSLMARIHQVSSEKVICAKKVTWDPEGLSSLYAIQKEAFLESGVVGADVVAEFFEEYHYDFVFSPELPRGVTHQDLKKENILMQGETLAGLIDFDNAYVGVLLHDIMTTLIREGYDQGMLSRNRCREFILGYESVRKLREVEKENFVMGFQHRLVREVFIGPFAAVKNREEAMKASFYFMQLFKSFGPTEERVLLDCLSN